MERKKSLGVSMVLLLLGLLCFGILWGISQGYLQQVVSRPAVCFLALLAFLFFGVLWFEQERYGAARLILLALCIVLGGLGRVVFAPVPSVQPTSFIVILCGMVFGGKFGFMVGVGAAFISNLFLGHGPWSLWQMVAWGAMGGVSGMMGDYLSRSRLFLIGWGFISGILFGIGMNVWSVLAFMPDFSWGALLAASVTSIYLDVAHGLSNSLFLYWQGERWERLLRRAKKQYQI